MLRTDADFWKALLKRSGDREAQETVAQETDVLFQTISYSQPLGSHAIKRILSRLSHSTDSSFRWTFLAERCTAASKAEHFSGGTTLELKIPSEPQELMTTGSSAMGSS